jgi:hypothetical protein
MFLPPSKNINTSLWHDNFHHIVDDYKTAMDIGYHFDYQHEVDISDPTKLDDIKMQLTQTGYFWQVSPLIYNREPIPFLPDQLKNCKTVELLMSDSIKPIFAIFSILGPETEIDPHVDTDDEIVTGQKHVPWQDRETSVVKYHLGIDVPSDAESCLVVDNIIEQVQENKLLCFDETLVHYAYNRSNQKRGVLIVSYLRNELYA